METNSTRMRVSGLVLARGGSEGVKKKNSRLVCGLPLLSWVLRPMRHAKSESHPQLENQLIERASLMPTPTRILRAQTAPLLCRTT